MGLVELIVLLLLLGLGLWLMKFLPLEAPIPEIIRGVVVVVAIILVIVWIADSFFGASLGAGIRIR